MQDYLRINRDFWNHRAAQHFDSAFYDNPGFLAGRNPLNAIEMALLGNDLSGQRALHLMCHFGQDTLALARLGAMVTGVDLSDVAIAQARSLQRQTGLAADFVNCNVLEIDEHLAGPFDLVFSSYGTIGWLPELTRWGQLIGQFLKPGGRFVFAEFHPVVWMLDDAFTYFQYPYFNAAAYVEESQGSYAAPTDPLVHASAYWNHSLADVLTALLQAGLTLTHFSEYDYSPYDCFAKTIKTEQGYQIQGLEGKLPMVFALEVRKPLH
ncbi:MAG: SAM-dependent methyltransferase [Bacteroidetes bacterium]|nr:MAG: SAM-dependent methyltransferase [Bacteroidota bacterium]PTM12778.1 MAG: SAM-dependent methyltransferase [Bacteroidota bacterium]